MRRLSHTVSSAKIPRPSGTCAIPARADRLRARPAEPLAGEHHVAGAAHGPGDGAERRRLAGAVRAEQRDDLALVDRERHAVQRGHLAVARGDVLQFEQRSHRGRYLLMRGGLSKRECVEITFALPFGIDHVHCYLLRSSTGGWILVDTGLGSRDPEAQWRPVLDELDAPIEQIVVTHMHPDHVGGARDIHGADRRAGAARGARTTTSAWPPGAAATPSGSSRTGRRTACRA